MSKPKVVSHSAYHRLPTGIEGFDSLAELAWICAGRGIMSPTKCGGN